MGWKAESDSRDNRTHVKPTVAFVLALFSFTWELVFPLLHPWEDRPKKWVKGKQFQKENRLEKVSWISTNFRRSKLRQPTLQVNRSKKLFYLVLMSIIDITMMLAIMTCSLWKMLWFPVRNFCTNLFILKFMLIRWEPFFSY